MPLRERFLPPQLGYCAFALGGGMNLSLGEGMQAPLRSELLELIINTVAAARPLVDLVQRKDRDLANQIRRALSSIGLNTAEGFGTSASNGNCRLRFESARGSLYEAQAGLQLAIAWGYFTLSQARATFEALDWIGKRLYGLARR